MHETWQFNTSTVEKVATYQNVSNVVQSMRDISPNSGAYFVSVLQAVHQSMMTLLRTREMSMKLTIHVCTKLACLLRIRLQVTLVQKRTGAIIIRVCFQLKRNSTPSLLLTCT